MISSLQHWFVFKIAQSGMCVSPSSSSQVSTTGRPVLALGSWNTDVVCKTHEKIIYWTQTTFPKKKFLTPPSLEVCVYLTSLLPCWIAAWMIPFCPPTPPPPSTAINRAVHGTLLCDLPFDDIHGYQRSSLLFNRCPPRAHTCGALCVFRTVGLSSFPNCLSYPWYAYMPPLHVLHDFVTDHVFVPLSHTWLMCGFCIHGDRSARAGHTRGGDAQRRIRSGDLTRG
jgi:hypothetical protein